jgi:hypothetical protein
MGCSSVAMNDESPEAEFDANGPAMSYIMAGCPALVGNLWTVTTKDLDQETSTIIEWIGSKDTPPDSLLHHLPEARNRCLLRFINGAALVYFGVPLYRKEQLARISDRNQEDVGEDSTPKGAAAAKRTTARGAAKKGSAAKK